MLSRESMKASMAIASSAERKSQKEDLEQFHQQFFA
jgi:hypothetical protein